MSAFFANQQIAFLTQHGKERVVRAALEPALGCVIHHETGFNTDLFGTFARDIARQGSQLDAARKKAHMAISLSGLTIGLASEGAFGPDPFTGMFTWNTEILLLLDKERGLEIIGRAQAPARSAHLLTADWAELEAFAIREEFPEHRLILRPESEDDPRICKDIADWQTLKQRFESALGQSASGSVFVESDLRAHANPTRMKTIESAAHDLVKRAASCCPACRTPGYAAVEGVRGLPCAACGNPTEMLRGEIWHCVPCGHKDTVWRTEISADARYCQYCNP